MKKNTLKGMSFSSLRAKLMSTVAMLLVASTLLVTSSYAWFVMSTAPEVITAGHCGMDVLGITLVSNMAAGVLPQKLTEQEVLDAAEAAKEKFSSLLLACLAHLDEA